MMKYAYAMAKPIRFQDGAWDNVRVAAKQERKDRSLVGQAEKILGGAFDPSQWLLTHATIVASVLTEDVPGARVGASTENGKKIVRKTTSYRVQPDSDPLINNNLDCWAKPVLLKSYKTFVGGFSFVEHVQIEELSKGWIFDAVAREIEGGNIYVDILVANDLKHVELIKDIQSGKMSTLSMGCSIEGSTCTKCGNWAADDTEFCTCVKYEKGNTFYDNKGQKHRVAELCGDESLEPTGGVKFLEGSWVETPAFGGAVARNIVTLERSSKSKKSAYQIHTALEAHPDNGIYGMQKAASLRGAASSEDEYDLSLEAPAETPAEAPAEAPVEEPAAEPKPSPNKTPFEDLEEELAKDLIEKVRRRVRDQMGQSSGAESPSSTSLNDTIVKQARSNREAHAIRVAASRFYQASLRTIVATSLKDVDLVDRVATLNNELGIIVPQNVYRAGLRIGTISKYESAKDFAGACSSALGRMPTASEARTLLRLATLLAAHDRRHHADKPA